MDTELTAGSKVYAWGSAEMEQFYIGEDEFETTKPVPISFFTSSSIIVRNIACGGQHTLFLSTAGKVYSMGSGDEG